MTTFRKNISLFIIIATIFLSFNAFAAGPKLTWLGHAAFLYKGNDGTVLLIDPFLANPKAPKNFKLGKIDAVLVTHAHSDHVGDAFSIVKKNKVPLVASHELTLIAQSKGVKTLSPLNPSGSTTIGKLVITAVEAVHSSGYTEGDKTIYGGAAMGFIIQEDGSPTLYHAGDTGVFSSMSLIKDIYRPDVVLLPIGGVYTMKPKEAAVAFKLLGAKGVVPMHYGTFPMLTGTPEELVTDLGSDGKKVHVLTPGTEVEVTSLE